ncbi:MAG: hypothetical protein QOJ88_1108 [Pyrinomonadaceae bacterium]|jgi:hypothetical protein|nr:hypothetical protein [Pyrinomonadaceae bacterium]MDQ1729538.1 hypothetical protein [Pyrinomonadaceae bacterium]
MATLFANFEVNRESRGRILGQLLVGSIAVHALVLASVMFVPGLRNAFNLASLIGDTRFVDKPYEQTVIGDDVQLIDLASNKFHYPEGYWAPEAPPGTMPQLPPAGPQFIAQAAPPFAVQPELAPSPSPAPFPSPSPPASFPPLAMNPLPRSRRTPRVKPIPTPEASPSPTLTADEAQKQLEKTAAQNNLDLPKENEINKKAMKDFAAYALDLKNQGKLDLNQPFEIVIEAELDQDGKLKDPKFTKKAGDPNLVDLFGRMVSALNDSGFLVYLKPLDKDNPGTKVVFTVKQGETDVLATVESEASSIDSARVLAKGFNVALMLGAQSRAGKDEEVLLRNTSAEPVGKKIVFNFTMPRQAVVDLIKKQLAEKPS